MAFDDYLCLAARDFSRVRLAVFTGRSGSGKSMAIRFLLEEHPDFRGREALRLEGPRFPPPERRADVIAVDDLTSVRDLATVGRLLAASRTLLVASHLSPAWFRLLHPAVRTAFFRTDRDGGKIERYLARLGVPASSAAVAEYTALFGATYTDLDIILERCPAATFDVALARFTKFCRVSL